MAKAGRKPKAKNRPHDWSERPDDRDMHALARIAERALDSSKATIGDAILHLLEVIADATGGHGTTADRLAARITKSGKRPGHVRRLSYHLPNPHVGLGDAGWDNVIRTIEDSGANAAS